MTASLPATAALPTGVTLEGTSGKTRTLSDYAGKVVVLIYEDRDSATQNTELKRELAARAQTSPKAKQVRLLPVADLHAYDFWPARGFARKAVVDAAGKAGVEILMDWQGSAARVLRLVPRQSQVLLFDAGGSLVFRGAGALTTDERSKFFAALDAAVGRDS